MLDLSNGAYTFSFQSQQGSPSQQGSGSHPPTYPDVFLCWIVMDTQILSPYFLEQGLQKYLRPGWKCMLSCQSTQGLFQGLMITTVLFRRLSFIVTVYFG